MTTVIASNRLLTASETADYLGVQAQTLAVWRSAKRYPDLPYVKVGNSVRYRMADLERWLASRTVGVDAAQK